MKFLPGHTYHVFNQGNNQETTFREETDYFIFLTLVRRNIFPYCEILAWCLMPNHFHLMIYTTDKSCETIKQGGLNIEVLTNGIRKLLSGYARIYNSKYDRTGSLFRQKTKCKILMEPDLSMSKYSPGDYVYACFNYIHCNPVEAGLVTHPAQWEYSSYPDYAKARNGSLCNRVLAAQICGFSDLDCR